MGVGKVIGTADGGGSIYHERIGVPTITIIKLFSRLYSYDNNIGFTTKNTQYINYIHKTSI